MKKRKFSFKPPTSCQRATPQHGSKSSNLLRRCGALLDNNNLLEDFGQAVRNIGLVGETRNAQIIFLSVISRLLDRPVSVVVKGARSGGKNTLVEAVLKFFQPSAYFQMTAMSEKAIAYFKEPLKNRTLVITEAAGVKQGGDYFLRSLLSEGRISYAVVSGGSTRKVELEGPTGLILTTTEVKLYEDDESRLVSIEVIEDADHTREILKSIGDAFANPRKKKRRKVPESWLALLEWIAIKPPKVKVPFARSVSALMSFSDTRLHRDANALFGLICAHALLHRNKRKTDQNGYLLATNEDYKAVRELIHDVIARGIESAVSPSVRRAVDAVQRLSNGATGVSGSELVTDLQINKAGVSRHVKAAIGLGYLRNLEEGKGKTARYVIGEKMPTDSVVLPTAKAVGLHHQARIAKRKVKAA
jgi:hypothetical protein